MTREKAMKHLSSKISFCEITGEGWADVVKVEVLEMALEALKQQERKKGKWEWDAEEGYWCSECKEYVYGCTEEIMEGSYKFCPFCGSENEENQWTEGKE